ncbi:MAG: hypothetical protein ACI9FG_001528 [Crocinitomicaceae bacterium]|jgi:uncharacterized protein (DUF1499 family)
MLNWLEPVVILLTGGVLSLKLLAIWSHTRSAAHGIVNGKLAPNNSSSNSVCSDGDTPNIAPLAQNYAISWEDLQDAVESLSGRFMVIEANYLHAVFRTPLLGFEDDFEARYDEEANSIHLRSASRVGYSDMGGNAKRVEAIKRILE